MSEIKEREKLSFTGTRYDKEAIDYLNLAVSDDKERPVLMGIFIDGATAVSANGFVMHIVPTPECLKPFDGKILKLDKLAVTKNSLYSSPTYFTGAGEVIEGQFPDYRSIAAFGNAHFQIGLNLKLLRNAIDKSMGRHPLSEMGIITIQEPYSPITVQTSTPERHNYFGGRHKMPKDKAAEIAYSRQRMAVIMPMHETKKRDNPFLSSEESLDKTYNPMLANVVNWRNY